MTDMKMTDHQNCRTWNWRTNVHGMKMQDIKLQDKKCSVNRDDITLQWSAQVFVVGISFRHKHSNALCVRYYVGLCRTRKPSYRWQTRATQKHAKKCSNSTCLQRCRRQYWPIFMRLAAVAFEICEIPRNALKIQTYEVQGHPRSSILVPIESPYVTCY